MCHFYISKNLFSDTPKMAQFLFIMSYNMYNDNLKYVVTKQILYD